MEDKFLKVAKQAALDAGKIISQYFGKTLKRKIKGLDPSNFATEADLEAEEKIVHILTTNFPDHNIIAEEKAKINNKSEYTWVVDPLDGTFSFSHQFPYFSVSIGLLLNSYPILGVINHVSGRNLFYAQKGKGSYLNGKPIQVSSINNLKESAVGLDFGHKKTRGHHIAKYVYPLIIRIGYPYSVGSAVSCQALVAQGILDGYVNQAWIWDFAAGAVVIREAGGQITDFMGREPDWSQDRLDIVASNGLIHDQIVEALR